MKKEFWIKKDRTKDGPDNWEKMSSYEFARFMETADGKSRKENIARVPGGESGEPILSVRRNIVGDHLDAQCIHGFL